MKQPLVVAITGASGVVYATRLLEVLIYTGHDVHLTISPAGRTVLEQELDIKVNLDDFQLASLMLDAEKSDSDTHLRLTRDLAGISTGESSVLSERTGDPGNVVYHHHADFLAPIASGSFRTAGMVICPCSGGTMSAVVTGASSNLVQRAADVHLKERRPLILVPRETPLSLLQLTNMRRACELGAVVLPAMPGWYHGVTTIRDLVDFIVGRILDQLKIEHSLMRRWGSETIHE